MITNFKLYENSENKKYWLIKISKVDDDSYFIDLQLYKIGMSIEDIRGFEFLHYHNKDAFIGYTGNNPKYKYNYSDSDDNYFDRNGYKYIGKVEITEEDILNYETALNAKKYNL